MVDATLTPEELRRQMSGVSYQPTYEWDLGVQAEEEETIKDRYPTWTPHGLTQQETLDWLNLYYGDSDLSGQQLGMAWENNLYGAMLTAFTSIADQQGGGMLRYAFANLLNSNWVNFILYLQQNVFNWQTWSPTGGWTSAPPPGGTWENGVFTPGPATAQSNENWTRFLTTTTNGFTYLMNQAIAYFGRLDTRIKDGFAVGFGNPSRGSGSGAMGPSFDIEQLTMAGQNIWRGLTLSENPNIRSLAQSYIDQVTANPQQALDFTAFIRRHALDTPRAKNIYINKPPGMSEEDYISQYYQAAMQLAGPHGAEAIAIGGAQMQADPYAYQQRLMRTDAYTSSSSFINSIEQRLRNLVGVLGG